MRILQYLIVLIIMIKIFLEIEYFYLKRKLHKIKIDLATKEYLQKILYEDNYLKIVKGKNYTYDIIQRQLVIKKDTIEFLDNYCIVIHEYGHYKDIYFQTDELKRLLIFVKILIPILFTIIIFCICGKYFWRIGNRILLFTLILELVLMILHLIMSIRLEFVANKNAIFILEQQENRWHKECVLFYCIAMVSQIIDHFFLMLPLPLIYFWFFF